MAGIKISALTAAAPLGGTEEVPIVQTGSTVRTTTQAIANLASGSTPAITVGITPLAGGGQTGATQLNSGYNVIGTVLSNFDSVQLPLATAGSVVFVFFQDKVPNTISIYAKDATSDTINGQSNGTQFDIAAPASGTESGGLIWAFVCKTTGAWFGNVGAD